jgi:hypothetical protein
MVFSIVKMHLTKKLAILKLSLYHTDVEIEKTEVIGAQAVMDTQEAAIV